MTMTLSEIIKTLDLQVRASGKGLDAKVTGGYTSDLLSDVLAHSDEGDLWITLQVHPNIIAIADMKGHAGIILTCGREPEEDTLAKAKSEKIPIMVSEMSGFELSGRLYALLTQ